MGHEVYICYSSRDKVTADAICHILEENKFKCWIKPRDVGVKHIAEEITDAIRASEIMVLVFSENAKQSNYVNTEVDLAFSSNKPILVFKIDNSKLDGGLEFFLENKHWLDAYPNPGPEFRNLVIDVSKLLDKPITDPIINKQTVNIVNTYSIDENEDKNEAKNFLKIFGYMCISPIIIIIIALSLHVDDTTGNFLLLFCFIIFILLPVIYFLMKKFKNK